MKYRVFLKYFPEQHNVDTKMSTGSNLDNFIKKRISAWQLLHQIPGDGVACSGVECTSLLAQLCA